MTRAKDPTRYPQAFWDIATKVGGGPKGTMVETGERGLKEARGLRFQWYYFTGALLDATRRGEFVELRELATRVRCTIIPVGTEGGIVRWTNGPSPGEMGLEDVEASLRDVATPGFATGGFANVPERSESDRGRDRDRDREDHITSVLENLGYRRDGGREDEGREDE